MVSSARNRSKDNQRFCMAILTEHTTMLYHSIALSLIGFRILLACTHCVIYSGNMESKATKRVTN